MEVGPLNLLFLPLLGGFLLYTRWNFVAFFAERCSGYRLLFTSATVGLLLLIAGRLAVLANTFLVIPCQASLVRWNHCAILSSIAITLVALLLLLIDCKRDRVLRKEFRESPYKPIWGALLSVVLCVAFIVFSKLRPEIHIISPQMAVAICLLILVSGGVTLGTLPAPAPLAKSRDRDLFAR